MKLKLFIRSAAKLQVNTQKVKSNCVLLGGKYLHGKYEQSGFVQINVSVSPAAAIAIVRASQGWKQLVNFTEHYLPKKCVTNTLSVASRS